MKILISELLILIFCMISCESQHDEKENTEFSSSDNKKAAQLVKADNEFGLKLFRSLLINEDCPDNVLISPFSVAVALGMTYNGAEGSTKDAFEQTLNLNNFSREEINKIHSGLINYLLSADNKVTVGIANSIWYRELFSIQESFITTNRTYYNAEVAGLDFSKPSALKTINGWIAANTNNKVKNALDQISPDAVMYLINALYYYGMWKYEFDEKSSFYGDFRGESNDLVVKYMKCKNSFRYFENDLFSMVELPYGNGNFVMDIFLPREGRVIRNILDEMTLNNWESWLAGLKEAEKVYVQIPKFKYEYKSLLNDQLRLMGLEEAFDERADFSGINPCGDLFISRVIHQTFIDINEKGTEAAGVTIVEIVKTSAVPAIPLFIANRPFIYAIRETKTGALLFIGKTGIPQY